MIEKGVTILYIASNPFILVVFHTYVNTTINNSFFSFLFYITFWAIVSLFPSSNSTSWIYLMSYHILSSIFLLSSSFSQSFILIQRWKCSVCFSIVHNHSYYWSCNFSLHLLFSLLFRLNSEHKVFITYIVIRFWKRRTTILIIYSF